MPDLTVARTLVKSPPELWSELREPESLAKHLGEFGEIRITRVDPETAVAWEGEHASGTVEIEPAGWGTKVTLTAEVAQSEHPAPKAAAAQAPSEPEPEPAVGARPDRPGADASLRDELDRIATRAHESFWDHLDDWPEAKPGEGAPGDQGPAADAASPPPERERRGRRWLRAWRRHRRRPGGAPEQEAVQPPPEAEAETRPDAPQQAEAPEPIRPEPAPLLTVAKAAERRAVVEGPPPAPPEPSGVDAERAREVLEQTLDSLGSAHHRPFSRGQQDGARARPSGR